MRTYALFKKEVGLEPYLWRVSNGTHRGLIAKLRMGVAPLRIELGRYEHNDSGGRGLPAERRTCQLCRAGCIEDEAHFVVECAAFERERGQLWAACERCPTVGALRGQLTGGGTGATAKEVFVKIMREPGVMCTLGRFLEEAFYKREKFLSSRLVGSVSGSAGRLPRPRGGAQTNSGSEVSSESD